MGFGTLSFVLLFLPLSVLGYYLTPSRGRNGALLLFSLLFCFLLQPHWLPVLCLSVGVDFGLSRLYPRLSARLRGLPLALSLAKTVLLLGGSAVACAAWELAAPVGLMVCSITAAGYLAEQYRGEVEQPAGFVAFALFCLLFCKLPTGPLVTWKELGVQLRARKPSLSGMAEGLVLLIAGLAKKLLLGDWVYQVHQEIAAIPYYEVTTLSAWMYTLTLGLAVVFELVAYADIARGIGLLFSLRLPGNMRYPAKAATVSEFFTRFNSTVTAFVERYVFRPLGGDGNGPAATAVNLLLCGLLCGVWFGFDSGFLLWGAFLSLFCIAERLFFGKVLSRIPNFFARIATNGIVLVSFSLFNSAQAPGLLFYLSKLFTFQEGLIYDDTILYILSRRYLPILLCLLMLSGMPHGMKKYLDARCPRSMALLSALANLLLLGVVLISLFYR